MSIVDVLHTIIARYGDQEICRKWHFQSNGMQATEHTEMVSISLETPQLRHISHEQPE